MACCNILGAWLPATCFLVANECARSRFDTFEYTLKKEMLTFGYAGVRRHDAMKKRLFWKGQPFLN